MVTVIVFATCFSFDLCPNLNSLERKKGRKEGNSCEKDERRKGGGRGCYAQTAEIENVSEIKYGQVLTMHIFGVGPILGSFSRIFKTVKCLLQLNTTGWNSSLYPYILLPS